jgi:outer membrane protein OmpA-like peptidoglycan-associated protein
MKRIITLTAGLLLLSTMTLVAQESPHQTKGDQYFDIFDYEKALSLYQLALEEDEFQPQVMRRIANTYRRLGDLEQCADWYGKTIKLDDSNTEDKLFYAEALKSLGRYDDAVHWYSEFAKANPGDARAKSHTKDPFYYNNLRADSLKYRMQKLEINSEKPAFGVCKFNDKYLFCAAGVNEDLAIRAQGDHDPFLNIYSCERNSADELVNAEMLKGAVNSKYHDGPVCFDPQNQIMYITRNNVKNGKPVLDANGNVNLKIFSSQYVDGKWGAVKELPFNSDAYSTGHASVSEDGNRLYFVSNMSGGYGGTDIYVSNKIDGIWSRPENLGSKVNTEGDEMFPFISDDGSIYFSSDGHAGLGGQDIFHCSAWGDKWAKAYNLGFPINTRHDDFSIRYETGDETGYFASNREGEGSDDIYFFSTLEIINQILAATIHLEDYARSLVGERIKVSERNSGRISESVLDAHQSFSVQVNEGDLIDIFMMSDDFNSDEPVFSIQIDDPLKDTYLNMGLQKVDYSIEYKEKMALAQAKLIEQENAKRLAEGQALELADTKQNEETEAQRVAFERAALLAAEAEAQHIANEAKARDMSVDEFTQLQSDAKAKGMTVDEFAQLQSNAKAKGMSVDEFTQLQSDAKAKGMSVDEYAQLQSDAKAKGMTVDEFAQLQSNAKAKGMSVDEFTQLQSDAKAKGMPVDEFAQLQSNAKAKGMSVDEFTQLQSDAKAKGMTVDEFAQLQSNAKAKGMTVDEFAQLQSNAKAKGMSVDEYAQFLSDARSKGMSVDEFAQIQSDAKANGVTVEEFAQLQSDDVARDHMMGLKEELNEMEADATNNQLRNTDDQSQLLGQRSMNGSDAEKIFFAFDQSYIGVSAAKVLDDIIAEMKADPNVTLLVDTHCDARGTDGYNDYLSEDRAVEIKKYMVWKGIDKDRLQFTWFGEEKLVNQCDNNTSCSSEEHKLNRRAELFLSNQDVATRK